MIDFDLRPAHTTNKHVYFSNGTHMTHDEWNTYKTRARLDHAKVFEQINNSSIKIDVDQHIMNVNVYLSAWKLATMGIYGMLPGQTGGEIIDEIANKIAEVNKPKEPKKKLGSKSPCIALRYIILKNNNQHYKWYFASEYCSHKNLNNEADTIDEFDDYWVCGGGFYSLQIANSLGNLNKKFFDTDDKIFHEPIMYIFGMSDTYPMSKETFVDALKVFPFAGRYEIRVMYDYFEFTTINNPNPTDT